MKIIFLKTTLIALVLSLLSCQHEDLTIQNELEWEAYIREEMEDQKIPAMAVLIFDNSTILYEGYYGESNIEQNRALMKDDIFLLASISKVVTATALLQLYEGGQFELDDNINDFLPFRVDIPQRNTPITFRMLLTHTSGIADGSVLDDHYYYGMDSPVELDFFLQKYLVPGGEYYNVGENFYDFEPGTEYEYSNIGSALIGVLVEHISGMNFNAYCQKHIFEPLEMSHTFWRLDEAMESNSTLVQPYNYQNDQYKMIEHYTFTDYPNGGLRSSARDLHKFIGALFKEDESNHFQLLQAQTVDSMLTPQIPSIDGSVGLHMFIMDEENQLWGHDGGEDGVATIMGFNKNSKIGALIFANQGDADLEEILKEAYKFGLQK